MRARRDEEETFEVPMTPLIDIVFLLLIFFLVATNFIRKEIDQKVNLPKAEGGTEGKVESDRFVINIRNDGTVVVNKRIVDAKDLRKIVVEWHGKHPDRPVSIRGDGNVPYKKIKWAMGICGAAGVERLDLPHEQEEGGTSSP